MSGPIGHTYIYNIVILFVVIVFAFLAGTLSYYKAFKINNIIISSLEKYEGYNDLSKAEIERSLNNIGYSTSGIKCEAKYRDMSLVTLPDSPNVYNYCIYIDSTLTSGTYHNYGVVTRMSIELPVIERLTLPVFTKTNRIYVFK